MLANGTWDLTRRLKGYMQQSLDNSSKRDRTCLELPKSSDYTDYKSFPLLLAFIIKLC